MGEGNVVIRRDLPTGKGERPSSHTPKPEDVNRGRGRSPGIRPGKNPTNEDPHDSSPIHLEKEGGLAQRRTTVSVREEGEKSRRIRKAFVRRQRRKREPHGRTRTTAKPTTGKPLGENLTPHRSNRGVRRDFGHLGEMEGYGE